MRHRDEIKNRAELLRMDRVQRDYADRIFVQGKRITFHNAGVFLSVDVHRPHSIELTWTGGPKRYSMGEVALIPTSFQQARLVIPSNMSER